MYYIFTRSPHPRLPQMNETKEWKQMKMINELQMGLSFFESVASFPAFGAIIESLAFPSCQIIYYFDYRNNFIIIKYCHRALVLYLFQIEFNVFSLR